MVALAPNFGPNMATDLMHAVMTFPQLAGETSRSSAGWRDESTQSGHWARLGGLGYSKARPGMDRPECPRAARGSAGLLRRLV